MTTQTKQNTEKTKFGANPFAKKFSNAKSDNANCVTSKGIATKSILFVAAIIAGVFLAFYSHSLPLASVISYGDISLNIIESYALIGAAISMIIAPIIAFLARITIPFTGSLFCAGVGYIYAFIANIFEEQRGVILFSMIITIALFIAINIVYMSGLIKVNNRFKTVTVILFTTLIFSSIFFAICYFIPALKSTIGFITENPLLSIAISVLGVIVAIMFMINTLDEAHKAVKNKISEKYEWTITFSLVFSIIWLFLEVVNLISKISNGK